VGDLLQDIHVLGVEDVIVTGVSHDDADIVAEVDITLVLEEVLDIRVLQRHHLAHVGIDADITGRPGKKGRCQRKQNKNNWTRRKQGSGQRRRNSAHSTPLLTNAVDDVEAVFTGNQQTVIGQWQQRRHRRPVAQILKGNAVAIVVADEYRTGLASENDGAIG